MAEIPSGHLNLEQYRNRVDSTPAYGARTQLYFEAQGARKRSAPTPAVSSQATPQEVNEAAAQGSSSGPAASTQGFVVQGPHLEDHTAYQITAAHMGKDVNNPKEVEAFLNSKVTTTRDVLRLVKNYHEAIIRPELYGAVVQLETAMGKMSDRLFTTQAELRFMASDNRQQQKAESGLKILLTGWPVTMPPQGRAYMIGWMLSQVPEIRQFMMNRALLPPDADHTAYAPEFWYHVLSIEPTTVPQGPNFSTMTMLNFKAWDIRSSFLGRYGGSSGTPLYSDANTPMGGKHIRVTAATPQFQRKLEAPLRVLIQVCNAHQDTTEKRLTILWKSLTLMAPSSSPDFDHDATAWARLFYEEHEGSFKGRLEVSPEMSAIMMSPPQNPENKEETLWVQKWNEVIWGSQWVYDQLDHTAYQEAKNQAKSSGRGIAYGGGRKHWSNMLLRNSFYSPYPFDLDLVQVEAVAFSWDEFCIKAGVPNEAVGDPKQCTFKGKPAAPVVGPNLESEGDAEMADPTMPPPAAPGKGFSKAPAPAPGRGKSQGRGQNPQGAKGS